MTSEHLFFPEQKIDEVDDKNPLNHYLRSQSSDSFLSVNVLK